MSLASNARGVESREYGHITLAVFGVTRGTVSELAQLSVDI
jgi:hypothetical protein